MLFNQLSRPLSLLLVLYFYVQFFEFILIAFDGFIKFGHALFDYFFEKLLDALFNCFGATRSQAIVLFL